MSDKPAESARPKVPTVEDTLRILRKISQCSGDPAKLILMRNFAEAYADSMRAELDRSKPAESARPETAQKFTKNPVTVDALQFNYNYTEIVKFVPREKLAYNTLKHVVFIQTLEGTMQANPGDWIIRGTHGEFYPCKPEIFAEYYRLGDADAESLRAELKQTKFEHQLRTHKFERDHQLGIPPCKLPTNICDQIMELYRSLHP